MVNPKRPIRILVIEDEAIVGQDVQRALIARGYDVPLVVMSGEEAIESIPSVRPDVVVVDIKLNGFMDGIETSQRISESFGLPLIFLTGCSDPETLDRARATYPFIYLIKPFNEVELQSAIEGAVSRHRESEALRVEHNQTIDALRSLSDAVISTDLAGSITFINPSAEQLTGWSKEEAVGKPLRTVFVIHDLFGTLVDMLPVAEGSPLEPETHSQEAGRTVVLTPKHGTPILVRDKTASIRDRDGSLAGLLVAFRAQEPAESRMIDNARSAFPDYLLAIVESISDPLFAIDSDGRIDYANVSASEEFSRTREELLGQVFWDQFPSVTSAKLKEAIQQANLRETGDVQLEFLHEGRGRWFDTRIYSFQEGVVVLLRDVTGRKLASEQRGRMDKLESLSLLARGFAHDFNNLLTVMLGHLSLAQSRMPEDADYHEDMNTALAASHQAQGLVQQLLTFARGGSPIRRSVNLGALLEQVLSDHTKQRGIQYLCDLDINLPVASVDPDQLQRMLDNLIDNSENSLSSGGQIRLKARSILREEVSEERLPSREDSTAENFVVIEVIDNGSGMDEEVSKHIFDPFFTTRQGANATGIGLTVCESIAKAHGGFLEIANNESGFGCTASVFLPVLDPTDAPKPLPLAPPPEAKRETRPRILVLDDEAPIRNLIRIQLERAGMEVIETAEGSATISVYERALGSDDPFDLLIIDLSIPNGMGGVRAMEKLREIDSNVNAIVSSGYSDDPVMSNFADYGFRAVLPKPYEPKRLQELVEELLGTATAS